MIKIFPDLRAGGFQPQDISSRLQSSQEDYENAVKKAEAEFKEQSLWIQQHDTGDDRDSQVCSMFEVKENGKVTKKDKTCGHVRDADSKTINGGDGFNYNYFKSVNGKITLKNISTEYTQPGSPKGERVLSADDRAEIRLDNAYKSVKAAEYSDNLAEGYENMSEVLKSGDKDKLYQDMRKFGSYESTSQLAVDVRNEKGCSMTEYIQNLYSEDSVKADDAIGMMYYRFTSYINQNGGSVDADFQNRWNNAKTTEEKAKLTKELEEQAFGPVGDSKFKESKAMRDYNALSGAISQEEYDKLSTGDKEAYDKLSESISEHKRLYRDANNDYKEIRYENSIARMKLVEETKNPNATLDDGLVEEEGDLEAKAEGAGHKLGKVTNARASYVQLTKALDGKNGEEFKKAFNQSSDDVIRLKTEALRKDGKSMTDMVSSLGLRKDDTQQVLNELKSVYTDGKDKTFEKRWEQAIKSGDTDTQITLLNRLEETKFGPKSKIKDNKPTQNSPKTDAKPADTGKTEVPKTPEPKPQTPKAEQPKPIVQETKTAQAPAPEVQKPAVEQEAKKASVSSVSDKVKAAATKAKEQNSKAQESAKQAEAKATEQARASEQTPKPANNSDSKAPEQTKTPEATQQTESKKGSASSASAKAKDGAAKAKAEVEQDNANKTRREKEIEQECESMAQALKDNKGSELSEYFSTDGGLKTAHSASILKLAEATRKGSENEAGKSLTESIKNLGLDASKTTEMYARLADTINHDFETNGIVSGVQNPEINGTDSSKAEFAAAKGSFDGALKAFNEANTDEAKNEALKIMTENLEKMENLKFGEKGVPEENPPAEPSVVPDNEPVNPTPAPDNKPKEIKFYNKAQRKAAEEIQNKYKIIRNDWNEVYPQSRKAMANYYEALKNAKTPADVDKAIARVMAELNKYIPG